MARLTNWQNISTPSNRVVAILSDSVAELNVAGTVLPWSMLLREKIRNHWGLNGTGLLGTWRDEWAFTTGGDDWTASTNSDTWSKGPYNGIFTYANTMMANGATKIATWTKPSWLTQSITSFKLYVVDGASSANFSYRIDGGTWTDVSNTWNQDNSFDIITVSSSVTSTIEVRGANAAGTPVNVYLTGVECVTGTGATLHDLSASGEGLYSTARSGGVADLNAWIDVIQPKLIIVCYTNDLNSSFWNVTRITDDLQSIVDRQAPYGYTVTMPFWGQDRAVGGDGVDWPARYTQHAGIYTSAATASSSEYIDLYARYGDYTAANALGYMDDTLHPSDNGSIQITKLLWSLLARGTGNPRFR